MNRYEAWLAVNQHRLIDRKVLMASCPPGTVVRGKVTGKHFVFTGHLQTVCREDGHKKATWDADEWQWLVSAPPGAQIEELPAWRDW